MWMGYAAEHWTKPVDARTGVERLVQEMSALEFDAQHEAVYGLGRFYTEEECHDIAKKYNRGIKLCILFLNGKYCLSCLIRKLCEAGLEESADDLKKWETSDSSESEKSDTEEEA
uniref:Uncharacterized protein n=1 Tax=Photinus pyralis TaxID=7054 RepID=A0A1Y1MTJ8_PHOPY